MPLCYVTLYNLYSYYFALSTERTWFDLIRLHFTYNYTLYNYYVTNKETLNLEPWTNTSRWHGSPNHHWLWKLHTGLRATWILCLSTLPPDSGTLISKWNTGFTFIWKEDFGPLSNSPVLFLLSPGKMLLTMFLFQKWLSSPFPEYVWAWWLLMHWLQLQFTLLWLCLTVFSSLHHPCCLCTFSYPISSFESTLHLICFDTALLEQPPFSVMTLFVEGVNDRLLDHCQVSSVPHYCAFKEQEILRIYTVWMVIYWNSNVNVLIFRYTDFWLSLAVSSNHKN